MWLVQTAFFIVFGLLPLRFAMADDFYQPDDPETQRVDAENLALAVLNFKTSANTTSLHLRENDRDKKVCKEVFKLLANDEAFVTAMRLQDGPDEEDWRAFLNATKYKKNAFVQTMSRFPNRFSVYFSFHSQASVANVRGFHCDVPDLVRAVVAEKLGPDKSTFALRQQVLETFVGHLDTRESAWLWGSASGNCIDTCSSVIWSTTNLVRKSG